MVSGAGILSPSQHTKRSVLEMLKADRRISPSSSRVDFTNDQLLHTKFPKAQKDSQVISVFLRFWDLLALYKLLVKCL